MICTNYNMYCLFSYHYRNWNNLQFACVCSFVSQKQTGKPNFGNALCNYCLFLENQDKISQVLKSK